MKHSTIETTSSSTALKPLSAPSRRGCVCALPALAMIATLVIAQAAPAQQVFADWDAGTGGCGVGVWTDDCWGCEPMPNNGNIGTTCGGGMVDTYIAGISDGSANVTMNINITLDGLIIIGGPPISNTMIMPNGRTLKIVGGSSAGSSTGFITIDDRLLMQSTGNLTDLIVIPGPDGSTLMIRSVDFLGELRMSNNIQNRIYGANATETIIFGSALTVAGSGQIGLDRTTLVNQGTIIADQKIHVDIDPGTGGMTNSGLMVARDGGVLQIRSGVYDNALGEIRAENASRVLFAGGAEITGGLIVARSGGVLDFGGGELLGSTIRIEVGGLGKIRNSVISVSTIEDLTNHGVIDHQNAATVYMSGQFNNTGSYFMNSSGSFTDLILDSDMVLVGGGVINMTNTIRNRIIAIIGGPVSTFTNVDNTIRGSGQIGGNGTTIINQGAFVADQSIELLISPDAGLMTNSGTLRAENGARLRLNPGPFTTSGFVFATVGSTIRRVALEYIQTAGSTIIDGSLTLNAGGTVTLDGGILGGAGQVNAHVNNVAGATAPGSSAGTLTVDGNYTQGIAGSLTVEIGGTSPGQFDVLAITGNATLAGTLDVTFIDGFDALVGQTFTIITAANVSGVFDVINSCAGLSVTYNPTSVVLTITSACALCPADTNGDSTVNVTDLLTLLGAWGPNPGHPADFNDDGNVNVTDLLTLLAAWGVCP